MHQISAFGKACGARPNMSKSSLTSVRQRSIRDTDWVKNCTWTNLTASSSNVYMGVLYGAKVDTTGIYKGPFLKGTGRLGRYHTVLRKMTLSMRIVVVNVFVMSLFSYLANFYPFPYPDRGAVAGSLFGIFMHAVRRAVLAFNGTAAKYHRLVMSRKRFGASVPLELRDLWAMVTATLAAKHDLQLLHGLPRSFFIGSGGMGRHGASSSLRISDSYANAAKDYVIATMSSDPGMLVFDACGLMELGEEKRRKLFYNTLILDGYALDQDEDLARILHKRGVGSTVSECFSYVDRLHANVGALPVAATRARRYIFAIVTNSVPTERRRMVITYPLKALRDAAPRVPCFICGLEDDGVLHVHTTCTPVRDALVGFMALLGLALPLCPPLHLALFIFDEVDKEVGAAIASFFTTVRSQVVRYFTSLGFILQGAGAAVRLRTAAIHDWTAGTAGGGLGSAGRRSDAQKRKCKRYGEETLRLLPSDAWLCYIDGSAKPNPGPCGTGLALYAGTGPGPVVFEASVPLGQGSNNIGEL